ncbi:streptophobe family protein [Streptomyces gibsoniae]|uniref:Streptophobe family protein n=1 Tax=Streptomyces gibsoniae TaxID=3075529 RepID=A0ABU2TS13_9ACTN|nr:streptophobe family protein [Streptomyces sp. DSM 41699]MDT0463742.1 streptophobe family protein [Streptomyces sp. DSM 41699]
MSAPTSSDRAAVRTDGPPIAPYGWFQAVWTVLAGLVVMGVVAALGLWAAGGTHIPENGFPRAVMAVVVVAVGGSVRLAGDAGPLAGSRAGLTVMPLSVTLAGALVIAAGFLRPLRHRAVAGASELAGWAARIAVLWLPALIGMALAARQTFPVPLGGGAIGDIGQLFGIAPRIGYTTDLPQTVVFGLLWLAGVLLIALLVSPGVPLPDRLRHRQESVRPAAYAVVALLLAYVALGVVIALVVAATRGHPAQTLAVILLGLPNLVWPLFTIGLGATWHGRVDGPLGLPAPHLLDEVLRTPDVSTLNLRTLAAHDGRVWWLVVVNAVLVLAAAWLTAARSPAGTRAWWHAARLAGALVAAVLMICLVCRIRAHYGLSLLGVGDLGGGLSGVLMLTPQWWTALGLAALWGLAAGFVAGPAEGRIRRRGGGRGEVPGPVPRRRATAEPDSGSARSPDD